MAVVVVDDMDGTHGARPVTFALDGTSYTLDLADHNLQRLRAVLAPYIAAARSSTPYQRPDRALNRAVRVWAAEQGIRLEPRGRIPNDVLRRWEAAGGPAPAPELRRGADVRTGRSTARSGRGRPSRERRTAAPDHPSV